jgi:hypothetical protein
MVNGEPPKFSDTKLDDFSSNVGVVMKVKEIFS